MARRVATVSMLSAATATVFAIACVDLFHSTDFKTLCTEKPTDPACGGGGTEAGPTDAGADAPKPEIDFCKLTPAEAKEKAIRTCAFLDACGFSIELNAFGECVSRAQLAMDCASNPTLRPAGASDKLWKCLAGITSCKDVEACVFAGPRQDCGELKTGKYTQCTDVGGGKVRIECAAPGGATSTRFETCALGGQTCTESGESISTCTGIDGYGKCSAGTTCNGTNVIGCQAGSPTLDKGFDCATVGGGSCVDNALGAACAPGSAAKPCDDGGVVATCDVAGTARACVGGKEIAIDCRGLGLACDDTLSTPTWDPAARCIAESRAPCAEPLDKCTGDDLRGCTKGESYIARCTSIGLGKCTEVNGRATCAKP